MNYYAHAFEAPKTKCVTLDDYQGESEITLACTQLDETIYNTASKKNKVLNDWISFLENNPENFTNIYISTRVNQKLFNALCNQVNLESLFLKWGTYPDLSLISNLYQLKYLYLDSGASLKDLIPLAKCKNLEVLEISTVGATDYSFIEKLTKLKQLKINSGMDNLIFVESLDFLYHLENLRNFSTTGFRLINRDYSPVLSLNKIEYLSINMPTKDHLIWSDQFGEKFNDIPYNKHLKKKL